VSESDTTFSDKEVFEHYYGLGWRVVLGAFTLLFGTIGIAYLIGWMGWL
jgi:hypothetical protein